MTHLMRLMFAAMLLVTPCVFSGCEAETTTTTTTPVVEPAETPETPEVVAEEVEVEEVEVEVEAPEETPAE